MEQPMGLSLASEVKRQIWESSMVDHILNCAFHCSTDTEELPNTRQRLRTVHAAVTPTKDLPAPRVYKQWYYMDWQYAKFTQSYSEAVSPQGSTMTPERARPFPNIFRKLFSW